MNGWFAALITQQVMSAIGSNADRPFLATALAAPSCSNWVESGQRDDKLPGNVSWLPQSPMARESTERC